MIILLAAALLALQDPAESPEPPRAVELARGGIVEGAAYDAALASLRVRAEDGDAAALRWMGSLIAGGAIPGEADPEPWYRQAMAAGGADEQARAAFALAGWLAGRPGRRPESRALLESISDAPGDILPTVQGYLGADYLFGLGGDVRELEGRALINSAMLRGFSDPAVLEAYGEYMAEVDALRAIDILRRAAEGGSPRAAWMMAMVQLENGGDAAEAFRYVAWAADQGHLNAMISRAVMLATGQGTAPDPARARQSYAEAAEAGSAHALRGLAGMYLAGEGGPVDAATGYALLEIAAAAGDPIAGDLVAEPHDSFALRPSDAEIASAGAAWLNARGLSADRFQ
jgi:hypothetical protein